MIIMQQWGNDEFPHKYWSAFEEFPLNGVFFKRKQCATNKELESLPKAPETVPVYVPLWWQLSCMAATLRTQTQESTCSNFSLDWRKTFMTTRQPMQNCQHLQLLVALLLFSRSWPHLDAAECPWPPQCWTSCVEPADILLWPHCQWSHLLFVTTSVNP